MIDGMRDLRIVPAERIIRQFGQMGDRIAPAQIFRNDVAHILVDGIWGPVHGSIIRVQPAVPIVAGIQTDHFQASVHEKRGQDGPNVSVYPRDKYSHWVLGETARVRLTYLSSVREPALYRQFV